MARRTNYSFERNARAKAKAAKREAKRQAKLAKKAETGDEAPEDGEAPEGQAAEGQASEDAQPPAETT